MALTIFDEKTQTSISVKDDITAQVILDLAKRAEVGLKKYGTTLEDNNTDDFTQHLYEELLDAAQYSKKLIDMKKKTG